MSTLKKQKYLIGQKSNSRVPYDLLTTELNPADFRSPLLQQFEQSQDIKR